MLDLLTKWRDDLHQIPEIGLKEVKTTAYLIKELKKMGYEPKKCLETGCYVYIEQNSTKTIAFRSDIDGLAIPEQSQHPYPSKHEGLMHACGHDGHMACLLGLAKALINKKLRYNVLLIFQPAEEHPGGARLVVASGLLEKYHVAAIFGLHMMPSVEAGKIALKEGPLMAQCGELDVKITGRGAHAGTPQLGIDTIMIASQLMNMYHTIITRDVSPLQNTIIHIGQIEGGSARNSVAEKTIMRGTIRAYDENVFHYMTAMIGKINDAMAEVYHCQIETSCPPLYPPVINDHNLCAQMFRFMNPIVLKEPLMLAEDFSFYQKVVPGAFMFLGTKTKQKHASLHSPQFDFDNDILLSGVQAYLDILEHIQL